VFEVSNDGIFVAIAAYRDPELRRTIESCVAAADEPGRLRFGVCLQYDRSGPAETQPDCLDGIDSGVDVTVASFDWIESKGGCWARHLAQGLYRREGFTLQIDSHTRMAPGWDCSLIDMMHRTAVAKPLLTSHLALYDVIDGQDVIPEPEAVPVTVFEQIDADGWIWHPGVRRTEELQSLRPTRVLSGGFVFTLGVWNAEVRQDPEHLYLGEELALSIRSFTHGYDLFNPSHAIGWHRHHPNGNHKFIDDGNEAEVSWRDQRAYRRLRALHRGDPDRVLAPYAVGTARSVAEYHRWAGIDATAWTVTDDARHGVTPPVFEPVFAPATVPSEFVGSATPVGVAIEHRE
jgi:hypothetical protein